MSGQLASVHVCYVQCNFCNTIFVVNVPGNNYLLNIVTVRCGHCANLLSVNMGTLQQALPLQDFQKLQNHQIASQGSRGDSSTSKYNKASVMTFSQQHDQQKMLPNHPPEKRQRVPSAYNRFIKEEIQRIKANNPDISHRKAFSAAAKNKLQNHQIASQGSHGGCSSTSKYNKASVMTFSQQHDQQKLLPIHPAPEKRQRVPSAYNRFVKEEIQRIKANNPDISHRKAFSAAAKNWAHFPRIHFGLNLEGNNNKQTKNIDEVLAARGGAGQKSQGLF